MTIQFPSRLQVLFKPARYKVLYGGRGGAKSWGIARALLVMGAGKTLRILCAREIQKSMRESVHQLLVDQIAALGLSDFYEVQNDSIKGKNGTLFLFAGLKHNIENIKSKEAVDIAWIEEARGVSSHSWGTLIPTIRKEGSEIWISFNPELDTDETYRRFVLNPPPGAVVLKINWADNPWFPSVLKDEMEHLRATDYDKYLTIWEGHTKQVLDGAIYANEIRAATENNQFTRVPYDASKPVDIFLDLGRRDKTAVWFAQSAPFEFRLIDYYENRGHSFTHYLKLLREKPYIYGTMWLPHDGKAELLASELTIEQQARAQSFDTRIVPNISVANGIEAARAIFNRCYFDEQKTADGLNCLRRYRYDVDPETQQYSRTPLHDEASHGADAFRYFAVAMEEASTPNKETEYHAFDGAWMG